MEELLWPTKNGNIDVEIDSESNPLLLAFIRRDYEFFKEQTEVLKGISISNTVNLKVRLLDDNSEGSWSTLAIEGTPTFVLFYHGEEKGRLWGKADIEILKAFLLRTLSDQKFVNED